MQKIRYAPLYILLLIFCLPVIAAGYFLCFNKNTLQPQKQHGTLILPPQKISNAQIVANKWNVIYADAATQPTMQKLQTALGKDEPRVIITHASWHEGAHIIDPNGMYIMHYPEPVDVGGLLKDLRRLLKYSHAQ